MQKCASSRRKKEGGKGSTNFALKHRIHERSHLNRSSFVSSRLNKLFTALLDDEEDVSVDDTDFCCSSDPDFAAGRLLAAKLKMSSSLAASSIVLGISSNRLAVLRVGRFARVVEILPPNKLDGSIFFGANAESLAKVGSKRSMRPGSCKPVFFTGVFFSGGLRMGGCGDVEDDVVSCDAKN